CRQPAPGPSGGFSRQLRAQHSYTAGVSKPLSPSTDFMRRTRHRCGSLQRTCQAARQDTPERRRAHAVLPEKRTWTPHQIMCGCHRARRGFLVFTLAPRLLIAEDSASRVAKLVDKGAKPRKIAHEA